MKIGLNKVHYPVTALGPGTRIGIWTQGCSIGCADCVSRDTWEPSPLRDVEVPELVAVALELASDGFDGVTISGGEPFDQADVLLDLITRLRAVAALQSPRRVDILCYSGYPLKVLRLRHREVLASLDAVIAEPFNRRLPTNLIWRGSANQVLEPLSVLGHERYDEYVDCRPERPPMQLTVASGVMYIGVPRIGEMDRLAEMSRNAGLVQEGASWRA